MKLRKDREPLGNIDIHEPLESHDPLNTPIVTVRVSQTVGNFLYYLIVWPVWESAGFIAGLWFAESMGAYLALQFCVAVLEVMAIIAILTYWF